MMIELSEIALFRQGILAKSHLVIRPGGSVLCAGPYILKTSDCTAPEPIKPKKSRTNSHRAMRGSLVQATTKLRKCTIKCSNKEKLFGQKKIEMECKCPRNGFLFTTEVQTAKRMGGPSDLIRCENRKASYVM